MVRQDHWRWVAAASAAAVFFPAVVVTAQPRPGEETPDIQASISGYSEWKALTEKPYLSSNIVATLCRLPTPKESQDLKSDPHNKAWVKVFANAKGYSTVFNHDKMVMPVGSVFVKEKHKKADDKAVELLTVMRKRERGYNRKGGDWEYAVVDAKGKVVESGKLARCMSCHDTYTSTDRLSLVYLSKAVR